MNEKDTIRSNKVEILEVMFSWGCGEGGLLGNG